MLITKNFYHAAGGLSESKMKMKAGNSIHVGRMISDVSFSSGRMRRKWPNENLARQVFCRKRKIYSLPQLRLQRSWGLQDRNPNQQYSCTVYSNLNASFRLTNYYSLLCNKLVNVSCFTVMSVPSHSTRFPSQTQCSGYIPVYSHRLQSNWSMISGIRFGVGNLDNSNSSFVRMSSLM